MISDWYVLRIKDFLGCAKYCKDKFGFFPELQGTNHWREIDRHKFIFIEDLNEYRFENDTSSFMGGVRFHSWLSCLINGDILICPEDEIYLMIRKDHISVNDIIEIKLRYS